jgi:hypothetical protein
MKHALVLFSSALIAGLAATATAAAAADFTLDVPVRIENVPSMTTATVTCQISRIAAGAGGASAGRHILGRGSARIPVVDGRFDGTVTIEIDNTSIIPSSDARSFSCYMDASGRSRTGVTYAASPGNFEEVYQTATGQRLDRAAVTLEAGLP